ncbi:nucleotide pyrophosphohydrolase [Lacticaseibacillus suihuaensis]
MSKDFHDLDPEHHGAALRLDVASAPAIRATVAALVKDRDERGWTHHLKNLATALNVEAAEVLEIFTWKDVGEPLSEQETAHVAEELADVLIFVFDMCAKLDLDPLKLIAAKQVINAPRHRDQRS